MKTCSSCGEAKDLESFSRCRKHPDGRQAYCKGCAADKQREWRAKNPERAKALHDAWKRQNPEVLRQAKRASYRRTRATGGEKDRQRARRWHESNPDRSAAATAGKRAAKLRATPAWANKFFIEEAYDLARKRTEATGVPWHVDHLVPLRSELVCGLHVEHNLRVIPAVRNISKGNRHWPDMP